MAMISHEIALRLISLDLTYDSIGSDYSLVPLGNKVLPKLMLTQIKHGVKYVFVFDSIQTTIWII